jgi:hypothetical protein
MKLDNPTRVRIGMTGVFNGRTYRVKGRSVVGIVEGGVIYCWNEFNMVADDGGFATLVYEETQDGRHWRWFELFEPRTSITAEEAALKRADDLVVIDSVAMHVTRVDHSRVYHVEGEPPEGEHSGSVADYFNAEARGELFVVSWTGDEVEFYRGRNLSSGMVASAFNLRGAELVKFNLAGGGRFLSPASLKAVFIAAMVVGLGVLIGQSYRSSVRPPATTHFAAPSTPLAVGSTGHLAAIDYRVVAHAVTQIAEVGSSFDRHEFRLQDEFGHPALLIYCSKPIAKDWTLFTPLQPDNPLTPPQAGNLRLGQIVNMGQESAPVTELFRERIVRVESPENWPDVQDGAVFYGFTARTNADLFLVRWNTTTIELFQGRQLRLEEMKAAFPGIADK